MASKGNFQEQRHIERSSSTLGEMLTLSDTKEVVKSEEEMKVSTLCSTSYVNIYPMVGKAKVTKSKSSFKE